MKKRVKRDRYYSSSINYNSNFNDPKWLRMWYLVSPVLLSLMKWRKEPDIWTINIRLALIWGVWIMNGEVGNEYHMLIFDEIGLDRWHILLSDGTCMWTLLFLKLVYWWELAQYVWRKRLVFSCTWNTVSNVRIMCTNW